MKYIGNCADWIDAHPEYLQIVLDGAGEARPEQQKEDEPWKKAQADKWYNLGYDLSGAGWTMHYWHDLGMSSMEDLKLPIDLPGNIEWWFCKIDPCKIFPLHTDAFKTEAKSFRRFWIAMQDHIDGHIFLYENKLLEYKRGDIIEFDNPRAWHGAANIGFEPKVTFQIVSYEL
jgi:hypothetical protein